MRFDALFYFFGSVQLIVMEGQDNELIKAIAQRQRCDTAKLKVRTEIRLEDWTKRGYMRSLSLDVDEAVARDRYPRVSAQVDRRPTLLFLMIFLRQETSTEQFTREYVEERRPAVITGEKL